MAIDGDQFNFAQYVFLSHNDKIEDRHTTAGICS